MINKVHNENCLETMSRMENAFIDLTVTSPPYDNLRNYNGYEFDFEAIAKELFRVTKPGGVVVWVVGDATIKGSETGTSFKQALFFKECGFNLHDTMIYQKENYVPLTHNRYEQSFEYMFILSKGKPKTFNGIKRLSKLAGKSVNRKNTNRALEGSTRNRNESTIIRKEKLAPNIFKYVIGKKTNNGNHTAAFPEQLANDHIISWSNENDIVYDPFSGSGTTAKMSRVNNRRYIASEVSEEYCQIAEERLKSVWDKINIMSYNRRQNWNEQRRVYSISRNRAF